MTRRRDMSLRAKQRDHLFPGQPSGHPQHSPRSRHLVVAMIITAFMPLHVFAQTPIFSVSPSSVSLVPIQLGPTSSAEPAALRHQQVVVAIPGHYTATMAIRWAGLINKLHKCCEGNSSNALSIPAHACEHPSRHRSSSLRHLTR